MLVWDKAGIDYRHWFKLKHTYGIYFVTLEKSNSAAETCSVNQLDASDPRNAGMVSDHRVGARNELVLAEGFLRSINLQLHLPSGHRSGRRPNRRCWDGWIRGAIRS